jgi:hypothetical protein
MSKVTVVKVFLYIRLVSVGHDGVMLHEALL